MKRLLFIPVCYSQHPRNHVTEIPPKDTITKRKLENWFLHWYFEKKKKKKAKPTNQTNPKPPLPAKETKDAASQWTSNTSLWAQQARYQANSSIKIDLLDYWPPWPGSILTPEQNTTRSHFIPEISSQLLWLASQSFCCCSLPVRWSRRDLLFDPFWLIWLLPPLIDFHQNKLKKITSFLQKADTGQRGKKRQENDEWKSLQFSSPSHLKTVSYFWRALNIQSLVCKMRSKRKVEHMTNLYWLYISMAAETFLLFTVRRNTPSTSAAGSRREHLHYVMVSNNYKQWCPQETHTPAIPTYTTAPQNTTTSLFH